MEDMKHLRKFNESVTFEDVKLELIDILQEYIDDYGFISDEKDITYSPGIYFNILRLNKKQIGSIDKNPYDSNIEKAMIIFSYSGIGNRGMKYKKQLREFCERKADEVTDKIKRFGYDCSYEYDRHWDKLIIVVTLE